MVYNAEICQSSRKYEYFVGTMSCVQILFVLFGCAWIFSTASIQAELTKLLGSEGQWQVWKLVHGKSYVDMNEEQHRKAIWQANLKVSFNSCLLTHIYVNNTTTNWYYTAQQYKNASYKLLLDVRFSEIPRRQEFTARVAKIDYILII
jgi:hypothetical protein